MNRHVLVLIVPALIFTGTIVLPVQEANAYCRSMGGYSSYEAQARAKRKQAKQLARQRAQVTRDQEKLKALGYYPGPIDGRAGPGTRKAINDFQVNNGMSAASTLNSKTRAILHGGSAKPMPDLGAQKAAERAAIAEDQKWLQKRGYYDGPIDGIPGPRTRAAVADFRVSNNLGAGGRLDPAARTVLRGPQAVSNSTASRRELIADQRVLADLGYYKGPIDGQQGPATKAAIRAFNRAEGRNNLAVLDSEARAALREAQAEARWIKEASDDGVSLMLASSRGNEYRLRSASGDFVYEAKWPSDISSLAQRTLSRQGIDRVYVDISGLNARQSKNLVSSLQTASNVRVSPLSNRGSKELLFSRDVGVTGASNVTQSTSGSWISTLKLTSSKPIKSVVDVIGKSKSLTTKYVERLRAIHKQGESTLGGSLNKVRQELKRSRAIKSDEELEIRIRDQLKQLEIVIVPNEQSREVLLATYRPVWDAASTVGGT